MQAPHKTGDAERPSMRPGGPASLVGTILSGRYRIEEVLGEGGMGVVYRAEHTLMRKRLAVKVLHPEMSRMPEVVARFEREAMAAAHIEHPHVAAATDFGKLEDGSFFLVLEYVEGTSLRDALSKKLPLSPERALRILEQTAEALTRAHELGIVHRDLKPENVMLVQRGEDPDFVKVLDFGIAKVPVGEIAQEATKEGGSGESPVLTQLGMVYGTPEYMAPEQALGMPVDARADVYSLGVIAFEMLAGRRPFEHESKVALLGMHVTAPIPALADKAPGHAVPQALEDIVRVCLAKEASERYATAKELLSALKSGFSVSGSHARASLVGPLSSRVSLPQTPEPPVSGSSSTVYAGGPYQKSSEHVLSTLAKSKWFWLSAAGLASLFLVAVAMVVWVSSDSKPKASKAKRTDAVSVKETPSDAKPESADQTVARARSELEAGNYRNVLDLLAPLADKDRADVHAILQKAYMALKQPKEAMRAAERCLALDPARARDVGLLEDVRAAALGKEADVEAFQILETRMGDVGPDILFELASSTTLGVPVKERAKASLAKDSVRKLANPALRVLLDFRDAKSCEAKYALLATAKESGDARLLAHLRPFLAVRGCGFLGRSDCYPCMHRDRALQDAVSAIEKRKKG